MTGPEWRAPRIATVTNAADIIVPSHSATLSGDAIACVKMDLGPSPIGAHSEILVDLPKWFQEILKAAHAGRLQTEACQ